MRVTLLSPKGPLYRHRGGIFRKSLRYAPLTLTTLASLIPEDLDVDLTLFDEGVEDIPERLDADLVGMTVITGTAPRSYELAARFREQGMSVVLGGPHVTLVPDEAALHADAIVTGYAEDSWPALLRDFAAGRMQPRYGQKPDLDLGGRPFPRRDLLDDRQFLTKEVFEATRSCAHACDFCVAPAAWGRKQYQRPVEWVAEDIRRMGAKKAIFVDLNLISDRAYAARLFEALIPLGIRWFGLSTTLIAHDPSLLKLMARSGCNGLLLGFESIDMATLKDSRKGFNDPDAYASLVDMLHRHDITVMGCFVFGMDHDTPETIDRTARFVVEAGIDLPRFAVATPFPGTPLYRRMEAEGRILTRDWEQYDGQHVVFQPARMSVEELRDGHERAWLHAYSLPSIARRLWKSKTHTGLAVAANMGYRFYARRLHQFYNCDWFVGQRAPARPPATRNPAARSSAT